ncbi:MAG: RNA 2',3'-cyclic phosphodiesterase [Candidatus Dormibacteraceae bacterium]
MGADQLEESDPALTIRAFFGLPVPEAQRKRLDPFLATCVAAAQDFRWTPAMNLHLTVRFLGSIEPAVAEGIADRLAERSLAGFELDLGDFGTFKRGRLVRVVWLGIRTGAQAARELAALVEEECSRAGVASESRPFQPHLTLARARPRDGGVLGPLPDPPQLRPWRAEELILFRSHLGRQGAVYEPLRRIRLS